MSNNYQACLNQLEKACEVIKKINNSCDEPICENKVGFACHEMEILKTPKRVIQASVPVKMDDGSLKIFPAYRVQHNNIRGPFKGGLRYHPQVDEDEVQSLAF